MTHTTERDLTTFLEQFEDGSQLHHSTPATEVGGLNDEVLETIGELGNDYQAHPEYAQEGEGLGVTITSRNMLRHMPSLDYSLRRQPMNTAAHKVLAAFAGQMDQELDDTKQPTYVRIIASGPQSTRKEIIPLIWHTDTGFPVGAKSRAEITANLPHLKRWVTGMVVNGEPNQAGNTEWLAGDLVIAEPTLVPEHTKQYGDIFWSAPLNHARVTRDGSSIVRLAVDGEEPDPSLIRSFPDGVIGEIGTTTVHRGLLGDTALRLSLQCYFNQL